MSEQPDWEFIGNLGDASPLEYGGYFIYRDRTGVYEAEGALVEEPPETRDLDEWKDGQWTEYRFSLDKCFAIDGWDPEKPDELRGDSVLSDNQFHKQLPAWFGKLDDMQSLASSVGTTVSELVEAFCSDDIGARAMAWREVGGHWGFENLDHYPNSYTYDEINARYKPEIDELTRRAGILRWDGVDERKA